MATREDLIENPFPPGQLVRLGVFGAISASNLDAMTAKITILYKPRDFVS